MVGAVMETKKFRVDEALHELHKSKYSLGKALLRLGLQQMCKRRKHNEYDDDSSTDTHN